MNQLVLVHLPSFLRSVREAQGISQKELSEKLGITQPAITQYEKSDRSLAQDTLRRAAGLLNLNPDFLQSGIGNPFKQANENKIIKMFFSISKTGDVEYSLIDYIADYSRKAVFVFLKPTNFEEMNSLRVRKWQAKGLTTYALVVRDADSNVFIFKRKDGVFFNEKELILSLQKKAAEQKKIFEYSIQEIDKEFYQNINRWKKIDSSEISELFLRPDLTDYRRFIEEVLDRIDRESILGNIIKGDKIEKMKESLQKRHPSVVTSIYRQILRDMEKFLDNQLQ